MMVAQDARIGTQSLDRFGLSRGGNTLRPVCGCVIPVLGGVSHDGCGQRIVDDGIVFWGTPATLIYAGSRVTREVS